MVFPRADETIQVVREVCTVYYEKKWQFLAGAVVVCHS